MPPPETPESLWEALDRTLATGCARVEFEVAWQFELPDPRPRRRGGLLRPLIRAGSRAGRRAWAAGLNKLTRNFRWGEGYIDFRHHRCMLDHGSYALMAVGDRMWHGPSGWPIATLPEQPVSTFEPMWLLDLVRGVTDVEELGEELVSGRRCRRLRAHADLSRAAAAAPADLPVPSGADLYGDLLRLPLELWLDEEGYVRRLRQRGETTTHTLELVELGAEAPADWSRLPTFRSPNEANLLARRSSG